MQPPAGQPGLQDQEALSGVVFPVIGWWLYDIFYITPFLAIPYLHTVNREIFSD